MGYQQPNNPRLVFVDLTTSTVVAPAGSDTVQLKPPIGKLWQVIDIEASIPDPVGSAAGTHTLYIAYDCFVSINELAQIIATTGNAIAINNTGFVGDSAEQPTGGSQHDFKHQWLWASNSYPLNFRYDNDTDVNQTGTRRIELLVLECNEA